MATATKQRIMDALDELPGDSVAVVAEFVDYLRAKALARPAERPSKRVVRLGGLWKGYQFSEQEIADARAEVWTGLGQEPE